MTEENNIPVETTEIVDTPAVEEAVTEPVSEPIAEPVAEQDNLSINFDDLAPSANQVQPEPVQEQDLAESVAQKLLERLQQKPVQELDPSAEEVVTKAELQRMFAQIQEQQQAEKIVQQHVAEAKAVQDGYVKKLTDTLGQNGIDLNADQSLKVACDLLYRQMFQQKVQQLGRVAPVLTAAETHQLVQDHFKEFNKIFLANKIQKKGQTVNNLSPAVNAANSQGDKPKTTDEFSEFMKKKQEGSLTMKDITKLLASPTQKK